MKVELKKAVENESEQDLIKCLDYRQSNKIDSDLYYLIEKALIGTWHNQHEDLVNTIYLENLKDDRFVEPILNIAMNRNIYRLNDDDFESTLRKCVHSLKTINTEKSKEALEKLKKINNDNVKYALEMYE